MDICYRMALAKVTQDGIPLYMVVYAIVSGRCVNQQYGVLQMGHHLIHAMAMPLGVQMLVHVYVNRGGQELSVIRR